MKNKDQNSKIEFFSPKEIKCQNKKEEINFSFSLGKTLSFLIGLSYLIWGSFRGIEYFMFVLIFVVVIWLILWFLGDDNFNTGKWDDYLVKGAGPIMVTNPTPALAVKFFCWVVFVIPIFLYILKVLIKG